MTQIVISEIFKSIQGESSYSGFPFFFIRLTGCNLRCSYCDTKYAYSNGKKIDIENIVNQVKKTEINKILITGGEPLLQENVYLLTDKLTELGKKVFIETNGSVLIDKIRKDVIKIVDFKTPSSKMSDKNNFDNVNFLNRQDEVKFVISDENDFIWSINIIKKYNLDNIVNTVLFSPVLNVMDASVLAEWILNKELNVKFQIQLHKFLQLK